jgi:hypothetical protein
MSTEIDDGGPAFPHGEIVQDMLDEKGRFVGNRVGQPHSGMTLRDWFAGMALSHIGNEYVACGDITPQAKDHAQTLAAHAYNIADAMITGRLVGSRVWTPSKGMTLRDWFAGQALSHIGNEYVACGDITPQAQDHAKTLAAHAYNIADAMIRARKGGTNGN